MAVVREIIALANTGGAHTVRHWKHKCKNTKVSKTLANAVPDSTHAKTYSVHVIELVRS